MVQVSERIERMQGSERLQRLAFPVPTEGAIRLSIGEPDFPTPAHIKEAATQAMKDNFTYYGSGNADGALSRAICFSLKRDYGVERKPENVLVTAGGIGGINASCATYLNPGDEALVLDPGYSAYGVSVSAYGGKPVPVPLTDTFHLDLREVENRISKRTKIMFFANPSNPTGAVLTEEEIRGLAGIAREHDLILVVDEVYHKLVYEGTKFFSICQVDEMKDRAILLNSFSKTYAMTGWRVGYLIADATIIKDLRLSNTSMGPVNSIAQRACVAALTGPQDCVDAMRAEYNKRRKFVHKALQGIERILTSPSEGAFYFFPRFEHKLTSSEMTDYLAEKGILVRSGTEFGENGQKHIRISYSASIELLGEGMERLKKALDELG